MESTWIVNSTLSSPEIRNRLVRAMDGNDEIVVMEINPKDWAAYLKDPKVAWMNTHLG